MKNIAIIRDRGQLTISDNKVIRLHKANIDWDKILHGLKKVQSFKVKTHSSASEFLESDRKSH